MRKRLPEREDPFSGESRPRLGRIARDLDAVVTDTQSRDWAADRPDRVVFARLGQVRHRVLVAAGRGRDLPRIPDPIAVLLGVVAGALTTGTALAGPAAGIAMPVPLSAALAAVAGLWAGLLSVGALRQIRRHRDRRDPGGPAPADDPYRYAAFRRRIEACAATARTHRSHSRRSTAIDLEHALDWLSAAQSELPRR